MKLLNKIKCICLQTYLFDDVQNIICICIQILENCIWNNISFTYKTIYPKFLVHFWQF